MKKTMRSLISMILCLVMLLSCVVLSGCSKEEAAADPAAPDAPAASAPDASGDAEAAGEDVQTEPVVFVVRGINDYENKTDNEAVFEKIRELSGVDFELVVIPTDNWDEKVNMMLVSGDNWDVLNITESEGNWNQYYLKNALQPWDDYLQYMPNVADRLNEVSLKGCTLADGSIYALPRKEYFSRQYVPAIRQDWLDALGMECPDTLEELEAYFQAVIDENLNGNDNEIPIMSFLGMEITHFRPYFMGFYGDRYLTEDGTIMPWYMHENCYELLSMVQRWYANGWLHAEYQTMAIQDGFDLIGADRAGGWTGPYNAGVTPSLTIFENDPESAVKYVSVDNLTDHPAGGTGAWGTNPEFMPELVLNANSKNAKWAAKLLNWMFESEENYMLVCRGLEGSTWSYVDDTKEEYALPGDYSDRYLGFYLLNEWYDDNTYSDQYIDPENWKDVQVDDLRTKINGMEVIESCDWFVPYNLTGTEAEFLTGDSDTIINEATAKIALGEWGEEEWNQAVQTAWETEGQIYSKVWTEQYHAFVG